MTRIDTHIHSNLSDGTDTPEELMAMASRMQLDMIGLTDHDTVAGWERAAMEVQTTGVSLIRGVEMSCASQGITVHLLGYLFEPTEELIGIFNRTRNDRVNRVEKFVENLSADFALTMDDVRAQCGESQTLGRPHIADALVQAGYFPDRSAAFEYVLHPRGPYYVHHWAPDPVEAVEVIGKAGGVAVLAHPKARARQYLLPDAVIAEMAEAGLFGIERDHRDHDAQGRKDVEQLAQHLGLRIFGSSDYHGSGKPNRMGENLTDPEVVADLESRGRIPVLRP